MDPKYLIIGGLGLGGLLLVMTMAGGSGTSSQKPTTTNNIPTTTGDGAALLGSINGIGDLTGVDWSLPSGSTNNANAWLVDLSQFARPTADQKTNIDYVNNGTMTAQ